MSNGGRVRTDRSGLELDGRAALAFAFAVDGGHLDLVVGVRRQAHDGDAGQVWRGEKINQSTRKLQVKRVFVYAVFNKVCLEARMILTLGEV